MTRIKLILFKKSYGASKRLTFRHQPAHPKIKKQNADPYKKDQAAYPQKRKMEEKKKKDKPKNPNRISQSRFRLIITCDSPLQIHIHTNQTSVFQPIKQTNKKKRLQQ